MFVCVLYIHDCGGTAEPVAHNNPNPANWMTWHSSFFPSIASSLATDSLSSISDLAVYGVHFVLREENNQEGKN